MKVAPSSLGARLLDLEQEVHLPMRPDERRGTSLKLLLQPVADEVGELGARG